MRSSVSQPSTLVVVVALAFVASLVPGCPPPPECLISSDCTGGKVCRLNACVDVGEGEGEGAAAGEGEGAAAGEGEGAAAGEGEGAAAGEGEGAAAGEGEGAAGEGEGEGEGVPVIGASIADIYAAVGNNLDVTLTGVLVTRVIPAVNSDPAGFFIQDGATGPAMFVDTDANAIVTAAVAGDTINAHVTHRTLIGNAGTQQNRIDAMDNIVVTASGGSAAVDAVRQDVSGVDEVATLQDLESEAISISGVIAGPGANAGGNDHFAYPFTTTGNAVASSTTLVLRMPKNEVSTVLGAALNVGCAFSIKGNMWRFNAKAQPSIFDVADFTAGACGGTSLVSASSVGATQVALTFTNPIDAASITDAATQFTLTPTGTVQSAVVSGTIVTLTTAAALVDGNYTVNIDGSLRDSGGGAVSAGLANFVVGGAATAVPVITEVAWMGDGTATHEWVELFNTGTTAIDLSGFSLIQGTTVRPLPAQSLAAGTALVLQRTANTPLPSPGGVTFSLGTGLGNGGQVLCVCTNGTATCPTTASASCDIANPSGNAWFAGDNNATPKQTMERVPGTADGSVVGAWRNGNPSSPGTFQ